MLSECKKLASSSVQGCHCMRAMQSWRLIVTLMFNRLKNEKPIFTHLSLFPHSWFLANVRKHFKQPWGDYACEYLTKIFRNICRPMWNLNRLNSSHGRPITSKHCFATHTELTSTLNNNTYVLIHLKPMHSQVNLFTAWYHKSVKQLMLHFIPCFFLQGVVFLLKSEIFLQ